MENSGAHRRLTTVLAADVVGYSRMMASDEPGTLALIKECQSRIFEPTASEYRGRIVKSMGDGLLMEFGSVVDAVRFAITVQEELNTRCRGVPEDQQVTYRIGINIGDIIVEGDDIFGDGVNVAARIEALSRAGEICVTRAVVDHVRGKVDAAFEDLGKKRLKNIPEPVQVFRVRGEPGHRAGRPTGFPDRWKSWATIAAVCTVLLLATALAFWQRPWEQRIEAASEARMAFPLPDKPSIVVLPFRDLSEKTGPSYIADGITEDLITDLSKVSGLFVIARDSAFAYREGDAAIHQISEDLGVRYVLTGSVRRVDEVLRINAQVIDATTGGNLWADRFDGNVADLFTVQDRFVRKIIDAMQLTLTEREESAIGRAQTGKVAAKEAFQQGWELYSRFNEQDNARSVEHFKKAIELDPDYGRAYAALALVYLRASVFHWDKSIGVSRAKLYREYVPAYLQKASAYETGLVHVVRAMQHLFYRHGTEPEGANRGTDDARIEAGVAISLQPSDPEAHIMMGWALIAAGRPEEGLSFVQAAMRLNPKFPSRYVFFEAAAYVGMGDFAQAARALDQGRERDPRALSLAPLAASVHAILGDRETARRIVELWQPGTGAADLAAAVSGYTFPIRWVDNRINRRLIDGLRLATLPLDTTVATLVAELQGFEGRAQVDPIRKLGWFGPAAAEAVPALIATLGSEEKLVRREATITLGKIGPGARIAVPALLESINEPIIGFHTREALDQIGHE